MEACRPLACSRATKPGRSSFLLQYTHLMQLRRSGQASRRKHFLKPAVGKAGIYYETQLLEQLMAETGTWSRLQLQEGKNGRGMFVSDQSQGPAPLETGSHMDGTTLYMSIPGKYVLSTAEGAWEEVAKVPLLKRLLADCSVPWQIRLGGLLAVICCPSIQHDSDSQCRFWQRYVPLIPTLDEYTSVLFFSADEISALQDASMEAAARDWQDQVSCAYEQYFATEKDCPVTLDNLRWGVGTAQSRAFTGSKGENGQDNAMVIPFMDMLNHDLHPKCHTVHADTGYFQLRAFNGGITGGSEAMITYGKLDNETLVNRYGFLIEGNSADRLSLPDADALGLTRLRRHRLLAALGMDQDYGPRSTELQALHDAAQSEAEIIAKKQIHEGGELEDAWPSLWGSEDQRRIRASANSLLEKICDGPQNSNENSSALDECATLAELTRWAEKQLGLFQTSIEEDESLLLAPGRTCSARMELAIRFRLEKKRVLLTAGRTFRLLEAAYRQQATAEAKETDP